MNFFRSLLYGTPSDDGAASSSLDARTGDGDDTSAAAMEEPSDSTASRSYIKKRCQQIEAWWLATMASKAADREFTDADAITFDRDCTKSRAAVLVYNVGVVSIAQLEEALGGAAPSCIQSITFHMPDKIDNAHESAAFIKIEFDPHPPPTRSQQHTNDDEDAASSTDMHDDHDTSAQDTPFEQGRLVRSVNEDWIIRTPLDNAKILAMAQNILSDKSISPIDKNMFQMLPKMNSSLFLPTGNTQTAMLVCNELSKLYDQLSPLHLQQSATVKHDPQCPHLTRLHILVQRMPSISLTHLRSIIRKRYVETEEVILDLRQHTITFIFFPIELLAISPYQWIPAGHLHQLSLDAVYGQRPSRSSAAASAYGPMHRKRMAAAHTTASIPYESVAAQRQRQAEQQKKASRVAATAALVAPTAHAKAAAAYASSAKTGAAPPWKTMVPEASSPGVAKLLSARPTWSLRGGSSRHSTHAAPSASLDALASPLLRDPSLAKLRNGVASSHR